MTDHGLPISRGLPGREAVADGVVSATEVQHGAGPGVIEVLNGLVARRPRWGFWKLYDRK